MKIKKQLDPVNRQTAVALGFFDGVHIGHRAVIRQAALCRKEGLSPTVFTFLKSPQAQLGKKSARALITEENKAKLFEKAGAEILYTVDFETVRQLSPRDFVKKVLVHTLHAKKVFCGFNYHFGCGGAADAHTLCTLCREFGIEVSTLAPVLYDGRPVSSTRIRQALIQGDIQSANQMLGREFSFDFAVQKGNQLGTRMHTPTFNQPFPDDFILPKFGVYATAVCIDGRLHCGVTNIGVKPTVGADRPLAETWMPQLHCGDLYGQRIEVCLLAFLRSEKKFAGLQQLQTAIIADAQQAKAVFGAQYGR